MNHRSKKIISYVVSIVVIAIAAIWVGSKFLHIGDVEFTDNATVCRHIVPVNSRVVGYIKEIRFDEFQPVRKGDTLVIIDDADMILAVARAKADYQNALAGRRVAGHSVEGASARMLASDASIVEAKALMEQAKIDFERYSSLLEKEAVTRQQYDLAKTEYETRKARFDMLLRQKSASTSAVAESRRRVGQSDAGIELAEAMLKTSELNLSYCVIISPCDGFASRKEIQVGQLVQPGQTLLDVVDSSDVWVIANFKETQLKHIEEGKKVEISVDAIPDITYEGVVEAISKATGASLSILPQDNSSGNFVKVRQRIPVRIELDENPDDKLLQLRAGMNVECVVRY